MKNPLHIGIGFATCLVPFLAFVAPTRAQAEELPAAKRRLAFADPPYDSGPFSADGRYFVFATDRAVATARDGNQEVFRYDRKSGKRELVSVSWIKSAAADAASAEPVLSADGTVAAFTSDAGNLIPQDGNGLTDVFVRDLAAGSTTLVSRNRDGTGGGNGRSYHPRISANGRFVAFESEATDLVDLPDANGEGRDVFVHDRTTGVTYLVSVNRDGSASGDQGASLGAISANGRVIVFESGADDLVPNDGNGARDVFARDMILGVTSLVSVNRSGTGSGNGDSAEGRVSADGSMVAFVSAASDLVENDFNGQDDIFLRDMTAGVTEPVSVNAAGAATANGTSYDPWISADGTRVAFASLADDLVPGDRNGQSDVFVRDRIARVTVLVSASRNGPGSGNGRSDGVSLSADGAAVAFTSTATDLTAEPVDGLPNLYVHTLATGLTRLASLNQSGGGTGNPPNYAFSPALSGNASVVAFQSLATGLEAMDVSGTGPFYLFEVGAAGTGHGGKVK